MGAPLLLLDCIIEPALKILWMIFLAGTYSKWWFLLLRWRWNFLSCTWSKVRWVLHFIIAILVDIAIVGTSSRVVFTGNWELKLILIEEKVIVCDYVKLLVFQILIKVHMLRAHLILPIKSLMVNVRLFKWQVSTLVSSSKLLSLHLRFLTIISAISLRPPCFTSKRSCRSSHIRSNTLVLLLLLLTKCIILC